MGTGCASSRVMEAAVIPLFTTSEGSPCALLYSSQISIYTRSNLLIEKIEGVYLKRKHKRKVSKSYNFLIKGRFYLSVNNKTFTGFSIN